MPMSETCAVELRVQLPRHVVAEVEEVQRQDPELLSRAVMYVLARRTIYSRLAAGEGPGGATLEQT